MASVLIVDDEPNIRRMVGALIAAEGHDVREAPDGAAGVARAGEAEPDVVLLDLMMPGELDGIAALTRMREAVPDVPVIMMSGRAGLADAVKATRLGAVNFLEKPLTPEGVLVALASALELRQARREARALREDLGLDGEMVGTAPGLAVIREMIARVAPTDARVLVTGESGTGKELAAAAIHAASPRRDRPFVRVNCAAIPRDLVESEMFGHEKGAFTGAVDRRIGRFELAHTGTLFLDEVGDLGPEAQAKLLRAIEAKEIERVGGGRPIRVDVRVVSATNKDLRKAVADGSFREDLFFRLNVIPIALPPLRERPGDVPALVRHFSARFRARAGQPAPAWSADAIQLLAGYRWPGNIRELANIVERLAILRPGREVTAADVREVLPVEREGAPGDAPLPDPAAPDRPLVEALDEYERLLIARALSAAGGNVAEAARRLRTDRPNLYRRMKRLGLAPG
ncbi:MAG TPA: sigma-54 dependent transcriptional regulator [Gemmatimonadaceae bacterium]|nr:sigma-54 dependent transcriptional regulator [Gemmatimonadaceae bacterium]